MKPSNSPPAEHPWVRRMGVQIAGTLPEDHDTAMAILEYARQTIEQIHKPAPCARPVFAVVSRLSEARPEPETSG